MGGKQKHNNELYGIASSEENLGVDLSNRQVRNTPAELEHSVGVYTYGENHPLQIKAIVFISTQNPADNFIAYAIKRPTTVVG